MFASRISPWMMSGVLAILAISPLTAWAGPASHPPALIPTEARIFRYQPQGPLDHLGLYLPTITRWHKFKAVRAKRGVVADFGLTIPLVDLASQLPHERGWVIHQALPEARLVDGAAQDVFWREESGQLIFGQRLSIEPTIEPVATPIRPIASVVPGQGLRVQFGWRVHKPMPLLKDVYQGAFSCLVALDPKPTKGRYLTLLEPRLHYDATGLEKALGGPVIAHLENSFAQTIATELNKGFNKNLAGLLEGKTLGALGGLLKLTGQSVIVQRVLIEGTDLKVEGRWQAGF